MATLLPEWIVNAIPAVLVVNGQIYEIFIIFLVLAFLATSYYVVFHPYNRVKV